MSNVGKKEENLSSMYKLSFFNMNFSFYRLKFCLAFICKQRQESRNGKKERKNVDYLKIEKI